MPDEIAGEIVGVAVKLEDENQLESIKDWCAKRLVMEKIPERWFLVDEIPKSDRGKINRYNVAEFCLKN